MRKERAARLGRCWRTSNANAKPGPN